MNIKDRLYLFAILTGLGALVNMTSIFAVGRPVRFGTLYTIGNVLSLLSSAVIWGPKRQWSSMWAQKRRMATCCYLIAMVVTFVVAVWSGSTVLVLALVALQFCAHFWFVLSYIPYGRLCVKTVVKAQINNVLPRRPASSLPKWMQ
jgi:hypothetical protein